MRQMGESRSAEQDKKQQEEIVNQAQDAVDAINERMQQQAVPEEP